jgi:hypothetical protein
MTVAEFERHPRGPVPDWTLILHLLEDEEVRDGGDQVHRRRERDRSARVVRERPGM